jgi:hypothetical protein
MLCVATDMSVATHTRERKAERLRTRAKRACAGEAGERKTGAEGLEPPTYGFGDRRSTN